MREVLARARVFTVEQSRRAWITVRRHPILALSVVPALLVAYVLVLIPLTPSISDIRKARTEQPAMVLSQDGKELAVFKRVNRDWVKLADISPNVVTALIATEDHRFYQHHGMDVSRTLSAAVRTLSGDRQGGSTITQQLARNLYPEEIGRAPTLNRKLKEAITALKIEAAYSKDEILETYLNTVPFLYNAYGIEVAARTYFDKSADTLDVLEGATLVGMLKGTSYYNPVLNPERSVQRRNTVLGQLVKHGKLAQDQFDALKASPLKVDFERQDASLGAAPHVTQQLRRWLIDWADRNGYNLYADGLVLHTTIDSRLQDAANAALAKQADKLQVLADKRKGQEQSVLQAGFLALDPRNGQVRAWVGSRDFTQDQFDHVAQARRQPGSTFKPFVYGAAFEQGISPSETFMDAAVEIPLGPGGGVWRPSDAGAPSGQPMTLRDGLTYSKNTITSQLIQRIGPQPVAALARAMGVRQSKLDEVLSLALGTSPVTLREMVAAYGSIANGGSYIEPILVTRVENSAHKVLEQFQAKAPEPAMSTAAAQTLLDVMRGVIDKGTGTGIRSVYGIKADVAGKTGTTQDNTDGWFILMHPQLVAGAWVGFNDNKFTMGSDWGQGAHSALPMVGEFFQQAIKVKAIDSGAKFAAVHQEQGTLDPLLGKVNDWFSNMFYSGTETPRAPEPEPTPGAPLVVPGPQEEPLPVNLPSEGRLPPQFDRVPQTGAPQAERVPQMITIAPGGRAPQLITIQRAPQEPAARMEPAPAEPGLVRRLEPPEQSSTQ